MWTRADRDAAYNNAAAVSDSTQIMARRSEASAKLRGQRPKHLDLPYCAGERAKWDLFPSDRGLAGCLASAVTTSASVFGLIDAV
jgi:arylformamidase